MWPSSCRSWWAVSTLLLALMVVEAADDGRRLEHCESPCDRGRCRFEGCHDPSPVCVGGACEFFGCRAPSCPGGACHFFQCTNATCDGGSCFFNEPGDTLKDGYCDGGNCRLNGREWPEGFGKMLSF